MQMDRKHSTKNIAYRTIHFDKTCPVPEFLLSQLKYEYLRRELWVPLEKKEGRMSVLVDDPQNILKRNTVESLLKTKAVNYCVASREDILKSHPLRNRTAISLDLSMISSIRPMPVERRTSMAEGMKTLFLSGILKILKGETDFFKVLSVCMK
jgi:hypothetical protein